MGAHLRLTPDLPAVSVRGDAAQLRQVLFNLILNSVQAVSGMEPNRKVVEVSVDANEASVLISIKDRGDGIPADEVDRVRAAFFSRRPGGSGLGLAIADRIVSAHGGEIRLANLSPRGFTAIIVLPLDDEDRSIMQR